MDQKYMMRDSRARIRAMFLEDAVVRRATRFVMIGLMSSVACHRISLDPPASPRPVAEARLRGDHFILPVTVHGRPEELILDLGADQSVFRQTDLIELNAQDNVLDSLPIGPTLRTNVEFLGASVFTMSGADGLLGTNVLRHYDIEVDGRTGVMRLYAPEDPTPSASTTTNMTAHANSKLARALGYALADCANGRIEPGKFFVRPTITAQGRSFAGFYDSGAMPTIMSWEAAKILGLTQTSPSVRQLPSDSVTTYYDGPTPTWQATNVVLVVGGHTLAPIAVRIVSHIPDGHDGEPRVNLGNDAFRDRRILIAYSTGQVCVAAR